MNTVLEDKFSNKNHPKRILALDGGGVRGALTLGYLEKIESLLRCRYNNHNLVLSDYYDLIGGTSTGAIIASCLVIGKPVRDIISLYQDLGKKVFGKRRYPIVPRSWTTFRAIFTSTYKSGIIEKLLQDNLGDVGLGDYDKLKCPLTIISKRADSYSLWTVANHPDGTYTKAMAHLKLWELCRASSAAPYYFTPKKLLLKTRKGESFDAAFIDGGVSLANNPALQLFLTATIPSFGFNWAQGENNIFITSFGTGNGVNKDSVKNIINRKTIAWASKIPELFMTDALEMNQVILQLLGKNYGDAEMIDSQFGDLKDINYSAERLFSFVRFNVKMTQKYLKDNLGMEKSEEQLSSLIEMDHYENIDELINIGREAAKKINDSHLPSLFD
jgi:patatin-like phospholipase/acyl hydrolase